MAKRTEKHVGGCCDLNLKGIFRFFSRNTQPTNTPLEKIPWNEIVEECYDKNLSFIYPVIKVIYTDDKAQRAVILEKSDALYTIVFQKLYPFDDDELQFNRDGKHGYWSPERRSMNSIFSTQESAITAVYSEPPFKYNKCILWADFSFRVDIEKLYWIKDDGMDDPDDLCLHGHVVVKIGKEILECDATVSAAGLYLLRTVTEDHVIHDDQAMLPCCGHSMFANDDLSSVHIIGCPNGLDWSAIHEDARIKLVTEAGTELCLDLDDYRDEVYSFADKIESFYNECLPKNIPSDEYKHNGYVAFWNEWHRRRQ